MMVHSWRRLRTIRVAAAVVDRLPNGTPPHSGRWGVTAPRRNTGIEQGRGYGHAAKDPGPALFETFEHQHAGGEINPVGGQRQCFGEQAYARVMQSVRTGRSARSASRRKASRS